MTNANYGSYSYNFNGIWSYEGCYNSVPFYIAIVEGSNWYLYFSDDYNEWFINSQLNDFSCWAYCTESDVDYCDAGDWRVYDDGWSWDASGTADGSDSCTDITYTDTTDTTDTSEGGCSGYSCITITNMDLADDNPSYDFNGLFVFCIFCFCLFVITIC